MENEIILSVQGKTSYKTYALNFGLASLPFLVMGIVLLYQIFIKHSIRESDFVSVLIFAGALLWVGGDLFGIAANNMIKHSKAKSTFITIRNSTTSGEINGKAFSFNNKNIVSVLIQKCSLFVNENGVPVNFNPGIMKRLLGETSEYLCVFTSEGNTYYIDCLSSPESAKTTLDSIIAKNNVTR